MGRIYERDQSTCHEFIVNLFMEGSVSTSQRFEINTEFYVYLVLWTSSVDGMKPIQQKPFSKPDRTTPGMGFEMIGVDFEGHPKLKEDCFCIFACSLSRAIRVKLLLDLEKVVLLLVGNGSSHVVGVEE